MGPVASRIVAVPCSCLGILRLAKGCGGERLEAVAARAQAPGDALSDATMEPLAVALASDCWA